MYAFGSIIAKYAFHGILCGKFAGWRAIEAPPETPAECKTAATFAAAVSSKCLSRLGNIWWPRAPSKDERWPALFCFDS